MTIRLLEILSRGPILGDGAMGTQLMLRGLRPGSCGELWNVERPEAVRDIHALYAEAGCDVATTNTFGATRVALSRHGLGDRVGELCRAAVQRAREGAPTCLVAGDIGPLGTFLEPLGDVPFEEAKAAFAEQAAALESAGADLILVETMTDGEELRAAVEAAAGATGLPVCATFAFDSGPEFRTMMGLGVEQALRIAVEAGAVAVGANCGANLTLEDYARLGEQIARLFPGVPKILQPNAGAPRTEEGRLVYDASPEAMARLAARLKELGFAWIGGCCGTTPDHLAAMRSSV
ncbi:MAG: homocysteine S-methyltransferase family protein [Fimbriimonadales bacterium]|nr:homocysteine S-methyltransferase family protein [Fimbriimonadales bacterium]